MTDIMLFDRDVSLNYHYDEIGLLRPKAVADNGYRFYTMKQYEKFVLISAFKILGTPLKEIQSYFKKQDMEQFLHILKDMLIKANKKRRNLKKCAICFLTLFLLLVKSKPWK